MLLRKGAPLLAALLLLTSGACQAQMAADNPDWREDHVPPPPAFEVSRLIPFDVDAGSSLRFGVDPATLQIGKDGVVRYVVVARSSTGALNAMYEGIRCTTAEYKTYARYNADSGWNPVQSADWRPLYQAANNRYALALARQGLCADSAPPPSVQHILRSLRQQDVPRG